MRPQARDSLYHRRLASRPNTKSIITVSRSTHPAAPTTSIRRINPLFPFSHFSFVVVVGRHSSTSSSSSLSSLCLSSMSIIICCSYGRKKKRIAKGRKRERESIHFRQAGSHGSSLSIETTMGKSITLITTSSARADGAATEARARESLSLQQLPQTLHSLTTCILPHFHSLKQKTLCNRCLSVCFKFPIGLAPLQHSSLSGNFTDFPFTFNPSLLWLFHRLTRHRQKRTRSSFLGSLSTSLSLPHQLGTGLRLEINQPKLKRGIPPPE